MLEQKCKKCGSVTKQPYCEYCLLQMAASQPGKDVAGSISISLPTIEELNERFPQLEVTQLIGRGGMGAIYRARQTSLDRDVALKLIVREVSSDPAFIERFEREAKTLAKLSRHGLRFWLYDRRNGLFGDGVCRGD
jgi:eukaryotic-like serine/threonine-protein kinase